MRRHLSLYLTYYHAFRTHLGLAKDAPIGRLQPPSTGAIVVVAHVGGWVLGSAYNDSRAEIARAIEQILATAQFEVERLDEARKALADFRTTTSDFSDALIGRINRSLGAERTMTFDRDLKAVDTFRLL